LGQEWRQNRQGRRITALDGERDLKNVYPPMSALRDQELRAFTDFIKGYGPPKQRGPGGPTNRGGSAMP